MDLEYAKYKPYTVSEACEAISLLGYGKTSLAVEGYDNRRKWTFETLKVSNYVYHPRMGIYVDVRGLKAAKLLVQWKGGPPRNRQIHTGSLLMCVIDFALYEAAVNNEINQAIRNIRPAELAK